MRPLETLRQFFSRETGVRTPMDDPFVQIDREEAAKQMRLKERGAEYGAQNLPPANASSLDPVESEIVSAIGDHLNHAQINAANQVRTYESRLSELLLLHELAAIKSATEKALGDFKTNVINWQNRLANRRDAINESYHELASFKRDNELSRPFHEVPTKVVPISMIAFAWLAEAIGNSFFLRVNDEMGLLGGVIAAMVIAAINIIISVTVGTLVFPRANLLGGFAKRSAQIGIGLWLIFLVVWNLGAAHFRDAKAAGIENPEVAAIGLAVESPLGLDSLYSWGLLVIGILAAILAAKAGYQMDDPYPGYGAIGRRHRDRCEEYAEEVSRANFELKSIRDEAIDQAHAVKRELGQQFRERARIMAGYAGFKRRFVEHIGHLEEDARNLLVTYRYANRAARTDPPPPHFDKDWAIQRTDLPELHDEPVREADIEAAELALDGAIKQIADAFDESIHSLPSLDSIKQELASAKI